MTTASQTAAPARRTEPICPDWCVGHLDGYQSWEELADGSGSIREHCSLLTEVGPIEIAIGATELDGDNTMGFAGVEVYVNGDGSRRLTAEQATKLAAALLSAAGRIRGHEAVARPSAERDQALEAIAALRGEMEAMRARLEARVDAAIKTQFAQRRGVSVADAPGGAS